MEFVVLGLLMIQDLTVYQLNQAFNSGLALIYSASYGSLLSAIKKLLASEDITFTETVENGRNKKIYHITECGQKHFFKWMHADIPQSKLEVIALSKVFFLGLIESRDEKKQIIRDIIDDIEKMETQLNGLSQSLAQIQLGEEEMKIYRYQFRTLDYGILTHRVAKEWFQQILDEL